MIIANQVKTLPKPMSCHLVIHSVGNEDLIKEPVKLVISSSFSQTLGKYIITGSHMPADVQSLLIDLCYYARYASFSFYMDDKEISKLDLKLLSGHMCHGNVITYLHSCAWSTQGAESYAWELTCVDQSYKGISCQYYKGI